MREIIDNITPTVVLRLRIFIYPLLFCFSFFIFIGTVVTQGNYGACPLYANSILEPGSESNCGYPIAIAIIFQFLYILCRIGVFFVLALGFVDAESYLYSQSIEAYYVLIDLLSFLLTLISACILTAGRNAACPLCKADGSWQASNDVAQLGAWLSVFLWLIIGASGFVVQWKIKGASDTPGTYTYQQHDATSSQSTPAHSDFPGVPNYQEPHASR